MTERSKILGFRAACAVLAAGGLAEAAFSLGWPGRAAALADALGRALFSGEVQVQGSISSLASLVTGALTAVFSAALLVALAWRAPDRRETRMLALAVACWLPPIYSLAMLGVPMPWLAALASATEPLRWTAFLRFAALGPLPLGPGAPALAQARQRPPGALFRPVSATLHVLAAPVRALVRPLAQRGFPRGQRPLFRLRWWLADALLRPGVVWSCGAVAVACAVAAPLLGLAAPTIVSTAWTYGALIQAMIFLLARYRAAEGRARRSLLWLLNGFYAAAWVYSLSLLIGIVAGIHAAVQTRGAGPMTLPSWPLAASIVLASAAILVLLLGLAIALFYDGTLDPARAFQKTTIYGALTVTAGFLFTVLEETASNVLQSKLHISSSLIAGVAGAIVAMSIGPLKARIARVVETRLPALASAPASAGLRAETPEPAQATSPAATASPSA